MKVELNKVFKIQTAPVTFELGQIIRKSSVAKWCHSPQSAKIASF